MEKNYKIFIASCKKMLEKERTTIAESILKHNHLYPINMENGFLGDNSTKSLEIDMEMIEDSDAFICIFSFLYGEIIRDKIVKNCPIKKCKGPNCLCTNKKPICTISFTEFEYRYAKSLGMTPIVIWNEEYNSFNAFEDTILKFSQDEKGSLRSAYYDHTHKTKNHNIIDTIIRNHAYPYKTTEEHSFDNACTDAISSTIKQIGKKHHTNEQYFSEKGNELKPEFIPFIDKGDYIEFEHSIGSSNIKMIEKIYNPSLKNWDEAKAYANSLRNGGVGEWRLPTIEELKEIWKIRNYVLRYISKFRAFFDICGIEQKDYCFRSTSVPSGDTDSALTLDFRTGHEHNEHKTSNFYVCCVR